MCGAESGCHRHVDDAFVSCSRCPSDWPLTNGAWLHRISTSEDAQPATAASAGCRP